MQGVQSQLRATPPSSPCHMRLQHMRRPCGTACGVLFVATCCARSRCCVLRVLQWSERVLTGDASSACWADGGFVWGATCGGGASGSCSQGCQV